MCWFPENFIFTHNIFLHLFSFLYECRKLTILPNNNQLFRRLVEWKYYSDDGGLKWTDGTGGVASVERGQY